MTASQRLRRWSALFVACGLVWATACVGQEPESTDEATAALYEGSGSGGGSGSGSGSGDPGGGVPPGGGTPGGGTQIPSVITGAQLTLAYSGHAQYTLPAWSTLPAVQVVEQLMIARYTQPDFGGPVTSQGATIFLRVVGDPFVDTYVFNYSPGTPGSSWSFQDPAGNWFVRTGGAPSQAGPPMTGRSELIMNRAASTTWTPLTEWAIPQLYRPDGWPPSGAATVSGLEESKVSLASAGAGLSASASASWQLVSLNGAALLVSGGYGIAALSAFGGGPLCRPATAACGTSVVRVASVFVAGYLAMQAAMSGQAALQAAASGGAAGAALALWRSKLARDVLGAVITSAGTCAASSTTCGSEAAHFCAASANVPGNVVICQEDTWLTSFNGAGIAAAIGIALTGAIDLGTTVFGDFGIGVAR